jgi:hypothetical protein
MRATIAYTGARLLLFGVALGLIYLTGIRGLAWFALALLASGLASYILLWRMRDTMAGSINRRVESVRSRLDEGARAEDK